MAKKKKKRAKKKGPTPSKKKKAEEEDPIAFIQNAKERKCEIAGKKLTLHKWTLRQSLKCSGKINTLIRKAIPTGNFDMGLLMAIDLDPVIEEHIDDFFFVLASSIQSNFDDSEEDAIAWLENLHLEEALELFVEVGQLNMVPLMKRLVELGSVVGEHALSAVNLNQESPSPTL